MMELVIAFVLWLEAHKWFILFASWITYNRKDFYLYFVLQPLRGGNGVVQANELAKFTMVCLLVFGFTLITSQSVLQVVLLGLISGVAAIAGVQIYTNNGKDTNKNSSVGGHGSSDGPAAP